MALNQRLQPRQTQRIALTPALRHGLQILQTPIIELHAEIARLAAENPLILVEDAQPVSFRGGMEGAEDFVAEQETLAQNLRHQLSLMQLERPTMLLAQFLTGDLTDDGYLDSTAEELSQNLGLPLDHVAASIRALQACEPVGVGARNLAECLQLQLIDKGVSGDVARLACQHLDILVEGNWKKAEKLIGLPQAELEKLTDLIRTLNPRPARQVAEPTRHIMPEVLVEEDGQGGFRVDINQSVMPAVRLDAELLARLDAKDELLRAHRAPAEALVNGLAFRAQTLRQVATALVARQQKFFTFGPDHMEPLTRAALAEALNLHPSTVGRALTDKALTFNGVVYPLSDFLTSSVGNADGKRVSAYVVQRKIRRLIEQEDADSTLSDDEITTILKREGVDIARRTVAKYRGCMNVPSSFERSRRKVARRTRPEAPGGEPPDQP
ncbi:RNA polymerase factor sigma-54 [Actibacterium lipolyticum]|uniref:RNA polymerase sigma-54 factor n=1 Tax=Actibacterium lipolyticum TaxID=1524263 RepID=A0A238KVL6_9RHOB|nr:RNA polymerase factor sigma-54 [Actibacterium lipolyticum]SMX46819.1 RNA polymerase sigma-54 factor 1 [Actibacterium lipolyticum]